MTSPGFRRRTGLKYALGLPLVFVARGATAGCGNGLELRIRCERDFVTFDPANAQGDDELIARNIFAPLVRYRKGNNGWEVDMHTVSDISSPDYGKTFTFKLRPNQPWIDGRTLTTSDVKYSFERPARIKARSASQWSGLDSVTEGGDSLSATINLKAPRSDLLTTVLPAGAGCVVSREYVEKQAGEKFDLDPKVPTTGRYSIDQIAKGDRVVLSCNPAWTGDPVHYTKVTFLVVQDPHVAQDMWANGKLDIYQAQLDELDRIRRSEQLRNVGVFFEAPTSSVIYLALATGYGPLASPEARRALQLAIQPRDLGRRVYGTERNLAANGLVATGWPGHLAEPAIVPDPAQAKELSRSLGGKEVRIAIPPFLKPIYDALQPQLSAAGIATSALLIPPPLANDMFATQRVDAGLFFGPLRRFGTMAIFQQFSKAAGGLHGNSYSSEQYESLLRTASDKGANVETLQSLQRRLIQDGAAVPIVEHQRLWLLGRNVVPSFDPDGLIGDVGAWGSRG
jgi:peptide/nickel transport system substrate-binding protein